MNIRFRDLAICCLLFLLPNFACAKSTPSTPEAQSSTVSEITGLSSQNYPRVDGSSSTIPVGQLLAARSLGLSGQLQSSQGQGVTTLSVILAPDAPPEKVQEYQRLQRVNKHTGTHQSYMALATRGVDLILVARPPSAGEWALAGQKMIEFEVQPFARDALIFVANEKNPLRGLTTAQLHAIYEGKTTNWKSVGGADEPIRAYTRDRDSGSEELMRTLFMKERKMIDGGERMISSMAGILDAVARNPRGLGYSIFFYETSMNRREGTRHLAVDGILPTRETIADATYSLVSPVYVVTRKDIQPGSSAAILRDWLLSPDGQKLVAQSGYIPLP